uniref:T-complex-associated testis-expressed protein 1 n=1 Tax=Ceratitis capitata TaxID=7213 RepID=W8B827_CERCA
MQQHAHFDEAAAESKQPSSGIQGLANERVIFTELSETYVRCMQQSSVGVQPEDKELVNAYEVYKTSLETRKLASEADKRLYADAIINPLGSAPLSYICAKALAKIYAPNELVDLVKNDALVMRAYYDAMDIDLPLEKCCDIDDEKYWKRFVVSRHKDPSMQVQKIKWKNMGIKMKLESILQQIKPEYWDPIELRPLAEKIKYYITDLHIEHLRALDERFLLNHFMRDDLCSTTSSDTTTIPSSTTPSEYEGEEEESNDGKSSVSTAISWSKGGGSKKSTHPGTVKTAKQPVFEDGSSKLSMYSIWSYKFRSFNETWLDEISDVDEKEIRREKREAQRARRRIRDECKERKRIKEEQAEMERELAERAAAEKAVKDSLARRRAARRAKNRKADEDEMISVFDMEVEPPEENLFDDVSDARNPEKLKRIYEAMKDPAFVDFCHHLDLRFLEYFPYLTNLIIEFNGPAPPTKYEDWHFNVSTRDIQQLAEGLRYLSRLTVFALRNSRLNAKKLYTLTRSLKNIYALQSVDFSYDSLKDDCGEGLYELFQKTYSIKSLDLTGNELGTDAICELARALGGYDGCCQYLSLARNRLNEETIKLLCMHINNTSQVRELCLRGALLTQDGIRKCIAWQLIPNHKVLRGLDLSGVPIDANVAAELLKALKDNYKIRKFDICGCDIPVEMEIDFEILLKRNKFLFNYPSIGDRRKSVEDIDASIMKTKNKILLRAIDEVDKRNECLSQRPVEFQHFSRKSGITAKQNSQLKLTDLTDEGVEDIEEEEVVDGVEEEDEEEEEVEGSEQHFSKEYRRNYFNKPYFEDANAFNKNEVLSRFWYFDKPKRVFPNY